MNVCLHIPDALVEAVASTAVAVAVVCIGASLVKRVWAVLRPPTKRASSPDGEVR